MTREWRELKETIKELRDANGSADQTTLAKFLLNYMNVLEKNAEADAEREPEYHFCYECEERFNCPDAERYDGCEGGL